MTKHPITQVLTAVACKYSREEYIVYSIEL